MYLKSLKLAGFKSFADRTRLEFEPGVTVVVGPNGSGKSNIVDAIGWVMGTQSPTAMRSQRMEDLIFAGTATRPAVGRAEVTLVFDNTSGDLPLDLADVAITRRLYRDGSSDYEINGVGCRLLDIQELLFDSGVGRHQHTLVGQGQITSVLTAKPEDHRAVIEEAAGILKHRLRKDRSVRRLEKTEADVVRLQDILGEMRRQIRPLRRQAENAERHDAVRAELRAIRLWLGGRQLRAFDARLAEIADIHAGLGSEIADADSSVAAIEPELEPLRLAATAAAERLDEVTEAAAMLEATSERIRGTTHVAQERLRGLKARLEGADERRDDLEQEAADLRAQLVETAGDERDARRQAERAERELLALEDEERALAEQEGLPTEGATAMVRGDLRSLEAADERDRRESEQVEERRSRLSEQRAEAVAELARLESAREAGERTCAHRAALLGDATKQEEAADSAWESAERARREADGRVASLESGKEAIEAIVAGGADPRARNRAKAVGGDLGTVTEVLDVPASLASAVDAALGQWQDAIVFGETDSLIRAVGDLKSVGLGGLPLVTGEGTEGGVARELAPALGVEALVDLLGPHASIPVADRLLGDVVMVDGWAAGWEIVRRHPQIRAVTPDGDLVSSAGIRLVDPEGATPAMLEAAQSALDLAIAERVEARTWERQAREARDGARSRRQAAEAELRRAGHDLEQDQRSIERVRHRELDLAAALEQANDRIALLEEAAAGRTARVEELRTRLAALEGEAADRQRAWEEIAAKRSAVAARRDEARRVRQSREKDLGALIERRSMVRRRLEVVERESATLAQTTFDPQAVDRLEELADVGRRAETLVRRHVAALRTRQEELRRTVADVGARLEKSQSAVQDLRARVADARERRSAVEVERAELGVRREGVCEGLRRDADADEALALAAPEPEATPGTSHSTRVATLEADLRRMGPINPLAAEEFRELDERRAFLDSQLADLEQSRAEIRKVIRALDGEIEQRFMAAFELVSTAFEEHVSILFPGGRGSLVLTDPANPLTTGVDIKVQPLGKKVSRLSLLSGGEKSMAALAFLFAVFRAEPSPFYVLDEVEAALDDANLRRFLDLVEVFGDASQLVIVTHQQQTMEAADTLYGVTMEPGGSTKVVAKRMSDAQLRLQAS